MHDTLYKHLYDTLYKHFIIFIYCLGQGEAIPAGSVQRQAAPRVPLRTRHRRGGGQQGTFHVKQFGSIDWVANGHYTCLKLNILG